MDHDLNRYVINNIQYCCYIHTLRQH